VPPEDPCDDPPEEPLDPPPELPPWLDPPLEPEERVEVEPPDELPPEYDGLPMLPWPEDEPPEELELPLGLYVLLPPKLLDDDPCDRDEPSLLLGVRRAPPIVPITRRAVSLFDEVFPLRHDSSGLEVDERVTVPRSEPAPS
jgi:hypothetical protein